MTDLSSMIADYFDEAFYRQKYLSGTAAGIDALDHYLETGWKQGHDPSPDFSTTGYLSLYPDVREVGVNPLVHFALYGHKEGRSPKRGVVNLEQAKQTRETLSVKLRGAFDETFYRKSYPEIASSGLAPLDHYMETGWKQGKNPAPDFDTAYYLRANEDVRATGINPFFHYIAFGQAEGRPPNAQQSQPAPRPLIVAGHEGAADTRYQYLAELRLIRDSGVFDAGYYRQTYPDLAETIDGELLNHYYFNGWREGRNPSFYFNTNSYLQQSGLKSGGGAHPLIHYLQEGEAQGLTPTPWFRPRWYARVYNIDLNAHTALQHYMLVGRGKFLNPNPYFDCHYYFAAYPDIRANGLDPCVHYFTSGYLERRNPSINFDAAFYAAQYRLEADADPLLHYLEIGENCGNRINASQPGGAGAIYEIVRGFTSPSDACETRDPSLCQRRKIRAKAIAFYLPQFHPIPENDKTWGPGFTEWRNTARAMPRFSGHYQPRIPEELGYYDLMQSDTMARQIEMAKQAGLHGFCFYYYWFNGKRVLEKPVDKFLDDASLDMPFAVMWANENWTRRWDGLDGDILLHQDYSRDDEDALLADLNRHFADPRYIRIDGRPLFILYRPGIVPGAAATIARWRDAWKMKYFVEPLIFMVQGFDNADPRDFGLDGAVEFPPHHVGAGLPSIVPNLELLDGAFARHGMAVSYDALVERSRAVKAPAFPLLRGAIPSWDNEARRRGTGTVYHGSTPAKYENWLRDIASHAARHPFHGESLVFVNAWNEWAEAAYLEPDVHYGAAYLNATARALSHNARREAKDKIVVVSHDAHPHGAQFIALNMARVLSRQFGFDVVILVLGDGPLLEKFAGVAETHKLPPSGRELGQCLEGLARRGYRTALANTTVSGAAIPSLKDKGFHVVSLVHELPRLIRDYALEQAAAVIAEQADGIVFAAPEVRDGFVSVAGDAHAAKFVIRPQGNYRRWVSAPAEARELRRELGLGPNDKLVINVAYADLRKGFDIFLNAAKLLIGKRPDVHFLWVGGGTSDVHNWLLDDLAHDSAVAARFRLRPFTDNVVPVYEAADLFFLSSREDPFPTAVLEALRAGLPVVGLEGSGGSAGLIAEHGLLAARSDLAAAAAAIETLLDLPGGEKQRRAKARVAAIARDFRYDDYVYDLTAIAGLHHSRISVVVPNYNYVHYIAARLDSIYDQTHPLFEVIVLDDKSTDQSLARIEAYAGSTGRDFHLAANQANSASGYKQWLKGAGMARGDYVWIAEADDLADPAFLDRAASILDNSDAAFVFCDSRQIDEDGKELAGNYQYYYKDLGAGVLSADFIMDGPDFVRRFLSVKNVILNVSGVLWRRNALLHALAATAAEHLTMRVACDWKMYAIAALECGPVGFVAEPLNVHRRHSQSVTKARDAGLHYAEITAAQDFVASRLELDAKTLARREAYRKEVKAYLEAKADPGQNPARNKRRRAVGAANRRTRQ